MIVRFNKNISNDNSKPNEQLLAVLSITRYKLSHFMEMHNILLSLMNNNDLSTISRGQRKNAEILTAIVVGLLDPPKASTVTKSAKTTPKQNLTAPADLQKIIIWIEKVALAKRISVEKLLDDFYSLGIVEYKA